MPLAFNGKEYFSLWYNGTIYEKGYYNGMRVLGKPDTTPWLRASRKYVINFHSVQGDGLLYTNNNAIQTVEDALAGKSGQMRFSLNFKIHSSVWANSTGTSEVLNVDNLLKVKTSNGYLVFFFPVLGKTYYCKKEELINGWNKFYLETDNITLTLTVNNYKHTLNDVHTWQEVRSVTYSPNYADRWYVSVTRWPLKDEVVGKSVDIILPITMTQANVTQILWLKGRQDVDLYWLGLSMIINSDNFVRIGYYTDSGTANAFYKYGTRDMSQYLNQKIYIRYYYNPSASTINIGYSLDGKTWEWEDEPTVVNGNMYHPNMNDQLSYVLAGGGSRYTESLRGTLWIDEYKLFIGGELYHDGKDLLRGIDLGDSYAVWSTQVSGDEPLEFSAAGSIKTVKNVSEVKAIESKYIGSGHDTVAKEDIYSIGTSYSNIYTTSVPAISSAEKSWQVQARFYLRVGNGSGAIPTSYLLGGANTSDQYSSLRLGNTNYQQPDAFKIYLTSNGSAWDIANGETFNMDVVDRGIYDVRVGWDTGKYYIDYKEADASRWTRAWELESDLKAMQKGALGFLSDRPNYTYIYPTSSALYMTSTFITTDGKMAFDGRVAQYGKEFTITTTPYYKRTKYVITEA